MKQYAAGAGWALGMLVLILDGKTALAGAAEGVALCIKTLVPSLFPFFLLSSMMTGTLPGGLLLSGLLGGYPVGAGNVALARRRGQLRPEEAERMVVLCNCAGPSFLFGVVGPVVGGPIRAAGVWAAYLVSVLILWAVFPKVQAVPRNTEKPGLHQAMTIALRAMGSVCGWVIVFRTLLAVLDRWFLWLLPDWWRPVVYGILELSNGCLALDAMEQRLAFVICAGLVGFGGICVMLQTAGVTNGISLRLYFPGKLFQGAVSMLAASFLMPGAISPAVQAALGLAALLLIPILRKSEKRCGNYCPIGV